MVMFAVGRKAFPRIFKERRARDINVQLRRLLTGVIKVNLSVAFHLLYRKDIRLSSGKTSGVLNGVIASGKILEQHTHTHATTMTWLSNLCDDHWKDERVSANKNQVFVFFHRVPLLLPYVTRAPNRAFRNAAGKTSDEEVLVKLH